MTEERKQELFAQFTDDMKLLIEREPDAAEAVAMTVNHIAGTYGDKYADGEAFINTKAMLYNRQHGTPINVYQVSRYLQRYMTTGRKKSYLVVDLFKAIHYLIFEITRRVKLQDVERIEPKV